MGTQSGAHEHGPERPDWSNGAQIFLEPKHAEQIEKVLKESGRQLYSKNVVISNKYMPMLLRLLILSRGFDTRNLHSGRVRFLLTRAGMISRAWWLQAPQYGSVEIPLYYSDTWSLELS